MLRAIARAIGYHGQPCTTYQLKTLDSPLSTADLVYAEEYLSI